MSAYTNTFASVLLMQNSRGPVRYNFIYWIVIYEWFDHNKLKRTWIRYALHDR